MNTTTFESALIFFNQGWVGSVIGLIGIAIGSILSILFYFRSKRKARPSVQLSRMTVLSPRVDKTPSDVKILYKDSEIEMLSKSNVILWNDGSEVLHGSTVVDDFPIQLCFDEKVTILQHQIVKETRAVNRARIQLIEGKPNAVKVEFDYLDPQDGINIELLHDSESDPNISGTIRGLPSGLKIIRSGSSPRLFKFFQEAIKVIGGEFLAWVALFTGLTVFITPLCHQLGVIDFQSSRFVMDDDTTLMISGVTYIVFSVVYLLRFRKRYPKGLDE